MKAPKSMRIWFAFVGAILWAGIYLTGFSTVNWLLFIPAAGFMFAAITGICPSLAGVFRMLGVKLKDNFHKQSQKRYYHEMSMREKHSS